MEEIDWSKIPNYAPLRALIADGYGGEIDIRDIGDGTPVIGSMSITLEAMEAMGAEGRERYGLEDVYQFVLAKKAAE